MWIERLLDVLRDVSYGLRLIRRSPSYSFVVIAVLAGGITVNLVAFGLFKALALAPLYALRLLTETVQLRWGHRRSRGDSLRVDAGGFPRPSTLLGTP